jgi:two-component system phosphate regulon sensor histidine kinase PhoR
MLEVAGMKSARKIYVIIAVMAAFGLYVKGLFRWHYLGVEEGWRFSGSSENWGSILPLCYIVFGALGVIWLGLYWLHLVGGIAYLAKFLEDEKSSKTKNINNQTANGLSEAINARFDSNKAYIAELEEQIKDLQIKIQLLRRQKRNSDAIIYSIRDAVIVTDEFDKLLMANESAGRVFGIDYKNSQHKPIGELIGKDKTEFIDFLRQSRQSKVRGRKREIKFLDDGKPRTFDCIVSCVHDQKDQVSGVVAVLHDITREKEISQMKNDFVSHVSHELKTPLASITAYSEMLTDGEANDEETRKEFYSVIQSQAQRLNRLIEDILNISRIESGLVKVEKKTVNLALLIDEQLQMIKSYAEEKNIKVIGPKSKDTIVFGQVYVDKDMISQVIVNLLSNAVKYTRPGGTVKIESEIDDNSNIARVSVTDTGVGIPEKEVGHLFEKFYRVAANKKEAKGTGLGLNLVKQIVEKVHNGKVFVTSKQGEGSTFGFEIPLATAETLEAV